VASQERAQVLGIGPADGILLAFKLLDVPDLVGNGLQDNRVGDELVRDDGFLLLDVAVGAQDPVIKRTAIVVASMWHETLGVDTELTEEKYRMLLESRHDRSRWDVVRLAWTADFNDSSNFLDASRAHSSNNDPGYENPTFDQLLNEATGTADPAHRRALFERALSRLDRWPYLGRREFPLR
jgi:ABC-type oligopeptide transport system substrate-binding subunit